MPSSQAVIVFFDRLATLAAKSALKERPKLDEVVSKMVAGFDQSHSITHLRNTWWLSRAIGRDTGYFTLQVASTAAYVHDCMDHKYLTPEQAAANEAILREVLAEEMDPISVDLVFDVVASSSFSVRRARLARGESEFPEAIKGLCEIMSDADLLEAYDPRRVLTFQANRWPQNLLEQHAWCRTIFEVRILRYRDQWVRTDNAKQLAGCLHPQLEAWLSHPDQQTWFATAELREY